MPLLGIHQEVQGFLVGQTETSKKIPSVSKEQVYLCRALKMRMQNKLNFSELCNKHLYFFEVRNKHPVLLWPLRVWQQATSHQLPATVATEQEVLTLETPYGCGTWQPLRANKLEHIKGREEGSVCTHIL